MSWRAWAMFVLFVLIAVPVGCGIYLERQYLPLVGISWLALVGVAPGFLLTIGLIYLARLFFRSDQFEIGAYGTVEKWFGRKVTYAPLTPIAPKAAGGTVVTEVTTDIPRLGELIETGALVREEDGRMLMLQGFRQDSTPRYGEWPGVIGVAGMQNVGKSVTIETLAIIALMQYARVVVCDTHHNKARSLYKKLQGLEGFITFAKTEKEVMHEAENFSQELANRKAGSEPFPYVFILDEAASVIRSPIGEQITTIIEEASQEGHGFDLHLVLAIHDFSKDGIGDARIRDFLNWIYCHRMQSGQSKFVAAFNTPKNKKIIGGLPAGHTVVKDEVNEVEYLIMPMADAKDASLARKKLETMRLSPVSQLSLNEAKLLPSGETVNVVNEPGGQWEDGERIASGESFTGHSPDIHGENSPVSPAEEGQFVDVLWSMQETGEKITRTNIQKKLGWNNRQYDKIKYLCEKHEVGKSEVVNA